MGYRISARRDLMDVSGEFSDRYVLSHSEPERSVMIASIRNVREKGTTRIERYPIGWRLNGWRTDWRLDTIERYVYNIHPRC